MVTLFGMACKNYQYNFLDEPSDKLKCLICLEVAIDPKQHETCGKVFCSECLEQNKNKPCPSCREEAPNYFKDTRAAQEIHDLSLWCNNSGKGCDWQGIMGTLDKHMAICEFEFVPCKYQYIGCDAKMMRKDITKHEEEDDKKHLYLALHFESKPILTLSDGESLVFKMTGYTYKKLNKEVFYSDPFYTHHNGYKIQVKIHPCGTGAGKGSYLSISVLFLSSPHDKDLQWPFVGVVSVEALNQIGNYGHFRRKLPVEVQPGGCRNEDFYLSNSLLTESPKEIQLIKNDKIFFRLTVTISDSPWLTCGKRMHPRLSNLCEIVMDRNPLVFKLGDYVDTKRADIYYTRFFLSWPNGYKMCASVYPNGAGAGHGTHVSAYIEICEGPYDGHLSWPFVGKVKFELLNQISDTDHYYLELVLRQEDNMQVGSSLGYASFIENNALQASGKHYLMNDTLYLRLTVSVDSHKSWLTCAQSV